jgi:flagellar hook-length control protein FliK
MTIEKSPASTAQAGQSAGRTDAHPGKSKAAAGDVTAAGGGFMAILGALGASGDGADSGATPSASSADEQALNAAAGALPAPFDASLLLQQNPQMGAAQAALATQAALAAAAAQTPTADAASAAPRSTAVADAALAAVSSPLPGAPPTRANELAGAKAPGAATAKLTETQASATFANASDTLPATESLTHTLQNAGAHAKGGKGGAQSAAADATSNPSATHSSDQAAAQDVRLMAALEASHSSQLARALEPVLAPLIAKAEKPQAERNSLALKSTEPTYGGTALGLSGPDFFQSGAPIAATAPELQVAEQVTYWVTQNVQNAELKLDGLGASPVEVSINLQGNEAQITFRSDEAATRGVLESAGAHLKDLLQREGLVLTGVSVGTSHSGSSGDGSERRGRPGAKQVAIAPLQVVTAETARRMGVPSGRSVDLFV